MKAPVAGHLGALLLLVLTNSAVGQLCQRGQGDYTLCLAAPRHQAANSPGDDCAFLANALYAAFVPVSTVSYCDLQAPPAANGAGVDSPDPFFYMCMTAGTLPLYAQQAFGIGIISSSGDALSQFSADYAGSFLQSGKTLWAYFTCISPGMPLISAQAVGFWTMLFLLQDPATSPPPPDPCLAYQRRRGLFQDYNGTIPADCINPPLPPLPPPPGPSPPPAPSPPMGDCPDGDAIACPVWASEGRCATNADFMLDFCQKSCGVCVATLLSPPPPGLLGNQAASTSELIAPTFSLISPNGVFIMVMQADGNLALYQHASPTVLVQYWTTQTTDQGKYLALEPTGELVVYDDNITSVWTSGSKGRGSPPYDLVLKDDGNLVILDSNNNVTWATNTSGGVSTSSGVVMPTGAPMRIMSSGAGLCVDAANQSSAQPLQHAPCDLFNSAAQRFHLSSLGGNWYRVMDDFGHCWQVPANNTMPGTGLVLWGCNGSDNQKFAFLPKGGENMYQIVSRWPVTQNVMCLGSGTGSLQVWSCDDTNHTAIYSLTDLAIINGTNATSVDCQVSAWSAWGPCNQSCGGGVQSHVRTITQQPANGGQACPALFETQLCNTQPCPVDCQVSAWSSWSPCSATCGGGIQNHTRTIITQPTNGGAPCPALEESQACNTQLCTPVDCQVSAWSVWGPCSVSCGGGTQTSTRVITTQPAFGGAPCPNLQQTQSCNTQPCTGTSLPAGCFGGVDIAGTLLYPGTPTDTVQQCKDSCAADPKCVFIVRRDGICYLKAPPLLTGPAGINGILPNTDACFSQQNYGNYYCVSGWNVAGDVLKGPYSTSAYSCHGDCNNTPNCTYFEYLNSRQCVLKANPFTSQSGEVTQQDSSVGNVCFFVHPFGMP